jgi:hypothetical protein
MNALFAVASCSAGRSGYSNVPASCQDLPHTGLSLAAVVVVALALVAVGLWYRSLARDLP